MSAKNITIYGGNGFVGTALAQEFVARGHQVRCYSRSGQMPEHLRQSQADWATKVAWLKGDAAKPDLLALQDTDILCTSIGSPPVPTFSKAAYDQQVWMNGTPNRCVIEAAGQANIKRILLVSAHMPAFLQTEKFGYYKGKMESEKAAQKYAGAGKDRMAVIVRPTGIYGTRHTQKGTPIPLYIAMKPIAIMQKGLSSIKGLPETLVSVEQVARGAANAVADDDSTSGCHILSNSDLIHL